MLVWLKGEDFIRRKTAAAYFIGRGDAKAAEQLLAHLERLSADPKDKIRAMVLSDQWNQINTYRWTVIMMEKCNDGKTRVARLRAIAASRS